MRKLVVLCLVAALVACDSSESSTLLVPERAEIATLAITSIDPGTGAAYDPVVIRGTDLGSTTAVVFGGNVPSDAFTVDGPDQVTAIVPGNAVTGRIKVVTPGGSASSATMFQVTSMGLTSFTPRQGTPGTVVTINGGNFPPDATVDFGLFPATTTTYVSPTRLTTVVPAGAVSGPLVVRTPTTSASSSTTFKVLASITYFTPTTGAPGDVVKLVGSGFTGGGLLFLGKVPITAWSMPAFQDTLINFHVPDGALSGKVSLTREGTTTSSAGTFIVAPRITALSPASGGEGSSVLIKGANLADATNVLFGGLSAVFAASGNNLVATVPAGAAPGDVTVTTSAGTSNALHFQVLPLISSLSPASGPVGAEVTITGKSFDHGAVTVNFGKVAATDVHVDSDTQIRATVPARSKTAVVSVTNDYGTGKSASPFTVGAYGASCKALRDAGVTTDGAYTLSPAGAPAPFTAWCDMTTDGGGWTLVLKTDASSAAHYTAGAVNTAALSSATLNTVAKLDDASIRALQTATGALSETRIESPTFAQQLYIRGTQWSVPRYDGYPTSIEAHTTGSPYSAGSQCYDSEGPCGSDHYCFGGLNFASNSHACIRRFATGGIWLNGAGYPAGYYTGRVWIR